jgi:hypothetical protein
VTTLEPTSESEDEDEMTLTRGWFTTVIPLDDPNDVDDYAPQA